MQIDSYQNKTFNCVHVCPYTHTKTHTKEETNENQTSCIFYWANGHNNERQYLYLYFSNLRKSMNGDLQSGSLPLTGTLGNHLSQYWSWKHHPSCPLSCSPPSPVCKSHVSLVLDSILKAEMCKHKPQRYIQNCIWHLKRDNNYETDCEDQILQATLLLKFYKPSGMGTAYQNILNLQFYSLFHQNRCISTNVRVMARLHHFGGGECHFQKKKHWHYYAQGEGWPRLTWMLFLKH